MATLREYFQSDAKDLTVHQDFQLANSKSGEVVLTIIGKAHYAFESRSMYISMYIPETEVKNPAAHALGFVTAILDFKDSTYVQMTSPGDSPIDVNDLVFTGRILLYDENDTDPETLEDIERQAKEKGHDVRFRSKAYAEEKSKLEKPHAFISHDSRDKELIAQPLVAALQKLQCRIWYDEYSLNVGDSLRESIEAGLKESRKCVLILSPNFLSNSGWGKREYDSIFTRELVEDQKVFLPIWSGVESKDIYQYSPMLADRVGLNWELGVEEVARKIKRAVDV